jgi:rare lipoprotein A
MFCISCGLSVALIQGCAPIEERDGAPRRPPDISKIPDPVPTYEPVSKRGNPSSYEVFGKRYTLLKQRFGYVEQGYASWYGTKFHGRLTSNGEVYNMYAMSAAHKTLPLPVYARVTNLENGKSVIVRINDRGPFHEDRIIDLSYSAAAKLDMLGKGTARVEVRTIDPRQPEMQAQVPETDTSSHTVNSSQPVSEEEQVFTTGEKSRLYLQIASYGSHQAALAFRERMAAALQQPVEILMTQINGKPVYRVWVGPLNSLQEADAVSAKLKPLGINSPIIMVN